LIFNMRTPTQRGLLVALSPLLYLCFIPMFISINVYKLYYLNSFIDFNFILSHGTYLLISPPILVPYLQPI
jgi:hypothetical protein